MRDEREAHIAFLGDDGEAGMARRQGPELELATTDEKIVERDPIAALRMLCECHGGKAPEALRQAMTLLSLK